MSAFTNFFEKMRPVVRRSLCLLLVTMLIVPMEILAQDKTEPPKPASEPLKPMAPLPVIQALRIRALAGEGDMNDLERHVMAPLVAEVRDRNDRPVEGADVVFRFPPEGPGALFPDNKYSQKTRTNAAGQAAAVGWMANNQVGAFDVHITASFGDQMGEATISMSNVTRITENAKTGKKSNGKKWWASRWVKIGIIAGGAGLVAGIVLATRGGGSSATPTITIGAGSPTIGGPH